MGPKTNRGLPLYIGRYLDKDTNRMKTLPAPSYLYNKTNYVATLRHA